jgi:serine/threonine-protein phosphatase 2A regulatory subunit A
MEIDPIDDGPVPPTSPPTPAGYSSSLLLASSPAFLTPAVAMTQQDEAQQTIELLRAAPDMAQRVAAAHRLPAVAHVLGPERTRTVRRGGMYLACLSCLVSLTVKLTHSPLATPSVCLSVTLVLACLPQPLSPSLLQLYHQELIPFVTDGLDDEDEVLLAMSFSLGTMTDAVGGPEHAHTLLRPLEFLLTVEETAVRERAAESTLTIAAALPDGPFAQDYGAMLLRLGRKEWFTARMSAARLIDVAYARMYRLSPSSADLILASFCQLCRDDTPMVRRMGAHHLGTLVQAVVEVQGRAALTGDVGTLLLPLYEFLASQDQPDSVRLQTTENCVAFGQVMSATQQNEAIGLTQPETALLENILPLVLATIDDRSWRVRWTAASKFAAVIQAYDVLPNVMDSLVPAYEKLLQDPEAEVRTAATLNLAHVAVCQAMVPRSDSRPSPEGESLPDAASTTAAGRVTVAERLVKRVTLLTEDDSEHVRAALAMVATELAPILGREATISHLVPPVLLLLRDAASEVRLNLIASLSALNEVIGVDLLSQSLLPAILDLAQDGKWRIRLAIIQQIPRLADHLGRDFFTERLVGLTVGWLGDDIATIRAAAAICLRELTALFGPDWTMTSLLPQVSEIRQHESYLRRQTALQACAAMSTKMDAESARLHVLPLVLEMATDPVANIRFNVAKELEQMAPVCGLVAYESQILPVLTMLMEDDDRDVRYYAEKTAAALDEVFVDEGPAS